MERDYGQETALQADYDAGNVRPSFMARIGRQLRRQFISALGKRVPSFGPHSEESTGADPSIDFTALAEQGQDPLHAVYAGTINLVSTLLEQAAELPLMDPVREFLVEAQDLYTPGYPPMSPITGSFFATWTMFDVRFGSDLETVGDLFAGVSDLLGLGEVRDLALTHLRRSRLGIYEVGACARNRARLRELVTNTEFDALIPSGFQGKTGEIILTRLLPPLMGELIYHVAATTPYILLELAKSDWLNYFSRHQVIPGTVGVEERLQRHMKFGLKSDYWSEYVFWGYVNHRPDAIFMTGFPDRLETLPQHSSFGRPEKSP